MTDHPGIVFRQGPAGRRAALADGADVSEIASAVRRMSGSESERVRALAEEFAINERQVMTALDYAAAHREEIDALVSANDRAHDEGERIATSRKRLLA